MSKSLRLPKAVYDRGIFGLAEAILDGHGEGFTGAACIGRHEVYDGLPDTRTEAAALCSGCPQRTACDWAVTR